MTEITEVSEVETIPNPGRACGKMLAEARKQQGKTIEDISSSLNLSVGQVRAIELDQSEGLPEPTYIRGYIRSYAKLLGLDPDEVLAVYANNANGEGYQSSLGSMPTELSKKESGDRLTFLSGYNIAIALVVASCLGFLLYTGMIPNPLSTSKQISVTDVDGGAPSGESQTSAIQQDGEQQESSSSQVEESVSDDAQALGDADEQAESALPNSVSEDDSDKNFLKLTFKQSSWLDVRDENNEKLSYQSYDSGDVLELKSQGKLHVFIGNAEGVDVELNGEPFDVQAHLEGVYAKFSIDPK